MQKRTTFFLLTGHLALLMLVASCGASRKVADQPPTPFDIIASHLASPSPDQLLADMASYPEYAYLIEPSLYHISYDDYAYKDIQRFSKAADDDFRASVFFDSLLVSRQEKVLTLLSETDELDRVGEYYRENGNDMDFLRPILKESYFSEVDSLDYSSLKSLFFAFKDTDLERLVRPRYQEARGDLLAAIMDELNPYFETEKELLADIDASLREDFEDYIEQGVIKVAEDLSERAERGLFKRFFKRKEIDDYSISEYAEMLIAENLRKEYFREQIDLRITDYIQQTTMVRWEYLRHYRDDAYDCPDYYIAGELGDDIDFEMAADGSEATRIQNFKLFHEATTVVSTALIFVPAGWVGLLIDGVDLYNGFTEDSKVGKMMDNLTSSLYTTVTSSVDEYLKDLIYKVDYAREESKQYIIRRLYEDL